MANQIPINFAVPSEVNIASYDYTDLEDGIGHVEYWLQTFEHTSGTDYLVLRNQLYSFNIILSQTNNTNDDYDWTFDSAELTVPKIIEGTAIFNFNAYAIRAAGPEASNFVVKVLLNKYDGTTTTQIGSTWSSALFSSTGAYSHKAIQAKITCPFTKLKLGEQIRIIIRYTKTGNEGENSTMSIACDPQNRAGGELDPVATPSEFTTNQALIPFKIDR